MKSGRHNLICVELTAEGVDAVAEAVIGKMIARGFIVVGRNEREGKESESPELETSHARAVMVPETGFLRLSEVLRLVPVGKTVWWEGVRVGKYPAGVKLSARRTAWRAEDIKELIEKLGTA